MKKLHSFILRTYLGPMLMTFFIVMFILLMQFLWKYIDDLVGKGLEPAIILELLLYASAGLMPMALPLATLLAALMTMGNLGEHYELLAIKSAGVSLPRIMRPLLVVSLLMTAFAFFAADRIVPVATLKMRTLIYSVQRQRPDIVIRPGVFYSNISGYSIRVGERERQTNLFRDITIYDHSSNAGNISVSRADSGYITITPDQKFMIIELFSGVIYNEDDRSVFYEPRPDYTSRVTRFREERLVKGLEGFGFNRRDEDLFSKSYRVMNTQQLWVHADSLQGDIDSVASQEVNRLRSQGILLGRAQRDSAESVQARPFALADYLDGRDTAIRLSLAARAIARAQDLKSDFYEYADNRTARLDEKVRYDIELHRKFALSVACLLFMLIGAPLGAIIRKGGLGLPVIISVLFFIFYYVLSITGEKLVRQLLVGPVAGMWGATLILLPIAVFLIYKATTDSVLLSSEWYRGLLGRLRRRRKS